MEWFLLTPESIVMLVGLILSAAITLYLLHVPWKTPATWYLAGAFIAATAGFSLNLLATFIIGPSSPVSALQLSNLASVSVLIFHVCFIQFTYAFLHNPFPREARAVLLLSGLLAWTALLALYEAVIPLFLYPLSVLLLGAWILLLFLRKTMPLSKRAGAATVPRRDAPSAWTSLFRPVGMEARAHRAFALLFVLFLMIGLVTGLRDAAVIPRGAYTFAISLLYPFFLFGFITVYVNHAPEQTTFQVKLVGLTLATTLTLLNLAALVVFADIERIVGFSGHPLPMPDRQTLQFEPTGDGGYRVAAVPFQFEDDPGRRLPLSSVGANEHLELGFPFPFQDSAWPALYVNSLGFVTFGERLSDFWSFWTTDFPKIVLLGTEPESFDVYARQDPGRATITWRLVPYAGPPEENTAQLTLYESGAFTFSYVYAQAPVFMRGIHPGGSDLSVAEIAFDEAVPFAAPARTILIEDTFLPLRRSVHAEVSGLFWLVLGSALFILIVFPLSFRAILTRPLERLLRGMRDVNAGALNTEVRVAVKDEIGHLTHNFNQMTCSLRDADAALRAYAEDLEARVVERTAVLEVQKAELEAQREQLQHQAERLRELDAVKARFFANISHEFRTPLTLLLGPIQDAGREGDLERLRAHLPLMQRNAERLLGLIGQLLDLSKLEAGGMQLHAREVDLVPLLRQLTAAFSSRAERQGLTLVFDAEVETLPCYVDADKLEKVVLNLLSNALKFTDRGGKVRLRLTQRRADTGAWAEITVQDTGRGIPVEELPRLFDRFHQVEDGTTRPHEGTGIGLALARELVELHHGTITIESTEKFGSTFTVRLPLGRAHLQPSDLAEPPGPGAAPHRMVHAPLLLEGDGTDTKDRQEPPLLAQGDRPTVLVVEDNVDMRAYLKSHLSPHYRVAEAAHGKAGLEVVRSLRPDLIISDVMMPEMDGYQLCRAVKADPALGHIPVVLLTARADDESRLEGLEIGADDYLAKPFNAEEMLLRVENLIEIRRRLHAHFSGRVVVGASQVVVSSTEAAFLEQVRDVIEAHLGDTHFGVERLADEVGLSTRQLLRRVKETAGLTPNGYIRMLRLERAAQLLEQRAGSVSEIAYQVGFNQPEYFSKLFRQVFGIPPSEYAPDHP